MAATKSPPPPRTPPPRTPRKRKRRSPRPPGEDAKKRARANQALELRIAGATYRQIAAQLGVSEKAAYYDVQDELARLDPIIHGRAERLRELENARLDRLHVALAAGIKAGRESAILATVRVMERRAKLCGLDAPERVQVSGAVTLGEKIAAARARGAALRVERATTGKGKG
jgi:hypothetical protein